MGLNVTSDKIDDDVANEQIINNRLRKNAEIIAKKRIKNKDNNVDIDPYFDSIKNWRPF